MIIVIDMLSDMDESFHLSGARVLVSCGCCTKVLSRKCSIHLVCLETFKILLKRKQLDNDVMFFFSEKDMTCDCPRFILLM